MFQSMFFNRSFLGFVLGILGGLFLGLAVDNVILGWHPELVKPMDLRLTQEWISSYERLPVGIVFLQFVTWSAAITLAAYLGTYIAKGVAIVGLGSGLAIWVFALAQAFDLPYSWWFRISLVLVVVIAPILGMMIGRYPFRKIPEESAH